MGSEVTTMTIIIARLLSSGALGQVLSAACGLSTDFSSVHGGELE